MQRLIVGITGIVAAFIALFAFSFAYAGGYNNSDYYYNYNNGTYGSYNNSYSNNSLYNYGYPYNTSTYNTYPYNNYNYAYNYGYQKPSCSITITRSGGGYGSSMQIAWSSSYATSAYISGIGSVGTNGSQAIYYPYNSYYTMTVYGPAGSATCVTQDNYYSNTYNYSNSYYPYTYNTYPTYSYTTPTYTYPSAYTYVNLNQMPYTGYDFGPVGNSLYWLTILLAALGGAYLIIYFHGGVHMREFARETASAVRNQSRHLRRAIRSIRN